MEIKLSLSLMYLTINILNISRSMRLNFISITKQSVRASKLGGANPNCCLALEFGLLCNFFLFQYNTYSCRCTKDISWVFGVRLLISKCHYIKIPMVVDLLLLFANWTFFLLIKPICALELVIVLPYTKAIIFHKHQKKIFIYPPLYYI